MRADAAAQLKAVTSKIVLRYEQSLASLQAELAAAQVRECTVQQQLTMSQIAPLE